jgi:hypothetical protein
MNDETDNLDQADEDIFTYEVSDEALEAAAGRKGGALVLITTTTDTQSSCSNACC